MSSEAFLQYVVHDDVILASEFGNATVFVVRFCTLPDHNIFSNMKITTSFSILLLTDGALAKSQLFSRNATSDYPPASTPSNGTRYAIMDNDWLSIGFLPFLLALGGGMKILGLASDTANTWVDQTTLHGVEVPMSKSSISSRLTPSSSPCSREVIYHHASPSSKAKQTPSSKHTSASRSISNYGAAWNGKASSHRRI
jgi:hypothetical protein